MLVVSNTSPLLNLAVIGRLALIRAQFDAVVVPECVRDEFRLEQDLPGSEELRRAIEQRVIVVEAEPESSGLRCSLASTLDVGEAAAIAIAASRRADLILLDDLDARHAAASLGLRVTGAVGILLRAKRMGDVLSVREELEKLRDVAGFRLSEALFAAAVRAAGEGGA